MKRAAKGDDIDSTAAVWTVRLDRGGLTDEDRESLERWLQQDQRHLGALVRAQAIWTDLDRTAALHAGAGVPSPGGSRGHRLPVRQWALPLAACLLIAIGLSSFFAFQHGRFVSGHGQVRHITLADGSSVVLDTGSVIRVRYTQQERAIFLSAGEASFQVAHNTQRPFIVHAEDVTVRAVGTNFAVSVRDKEVQVVVAQGTVEVRRVSSRAGSPPRLVHYDHELLDDHAKPLEVAALEPAEMERKLAWRRGLLIFDGENLAQAAAQVNRYAATPVVIDDQALSKRTFVGIFRVGASKAFADSAAAAFDAKVIAQGGAYHLRLTP
jgi:transmembrane sensor